MIMAKVSIAVSIYNVAQYIERCVRSLFEQTLEEMEYVFVDDGSTDDSVDILLRVLEEYPNRKEQMKLLRHDHNMGVAISKRDSMLAATGEYVLVVDSDDYIELNMAELLYNKAVEENADMVLCGLYLYKYDGSVGTMLKHTEEGVDSEQLRTEVINRVITPSLSTKLIRRELLDTCSIEWPLHGYAEDVAISVQVAYYSKRIANLPMALYHYCYNPKSICNNIDKEHLLKIYNDYKANADIVFDLLRRNGVLEKYGQCAYHLAVHAKCALLPIVGERKYRKMWFDTYPEMNKVIMWGSAVHHSRLREKIWYLSIWLGLYPRVRKKLIGKRLHLKSGWNWGAVTMERLYRGGTI